MKGFFAALIGVWFLSGCAHSLCEIKPTEAGGKVYFVNPEFAQIMPGRPLDRCTILSQVTLAAPNTQCVYGSSSWDTALKNKTADLSGNLAVFVKYDTTSLESPPTVTYVGIKGMAVHCPDEILKAAGLQDMINETLSSKDVVEVPWYKQ